MTKFTNGPAHGVTLMLRRIPLPMFLRVVISNSGEWDALDQLHDKASDDETLYAYEILPGQSWCHLNQGGGRGGMFAIAEYQFIPDQPDDATMRNNAKWGEWATTRGLRVSR